MRSNYKFLSSPEAFAEFVVAWEAGALRKSDWTHAAHVAVGTNYAVRHPATAFQRMKTGVIRHNEAVGTKNSDTSGYHETLTRLWIEVLTNFVRTGGFADPWEAACAAVEKFGENRDLHRAYYSFDIVSSVEARRIWIPPDLNPYCDSVIEQIGICEEWPRARS